MWVISLSSLASSMYFLLQQQRVATRMIARTLLATYLPGTSSEPVNVTAAQSTPHLLPRIRSKPCIHHRTGQNSKTDGGKCGGSLSRNICECLASLLTSSLIQAPAGLSTEYGGAESVTEPCESITTKMDFTMSVSVSPCKLMLHAPRGEVYLSPFFLHSLHEEFKDFYLWLN